MTSGKQDRTPVLYQLTPNAELQYFVNPALFMSLFALDVQITFLIKLKVPFIKELVNRKF